MVGRRAKEASCGHMRWICMRRMCMRRMCMRERNPVGRTPEANGDTVALTVEAYQGRCALAHRPALHDGATHAYLFAGLVYHARSKESGGRFALKQFKSQRVRPHCCMDRLHSMRPNMK